MFGLEKCYKGYRVTKHQYTNWEQISTVKYLPRTTQPNLNASVTCSTPLRNVCLMDLYGALAPFLGASKLLGLPIQWPTDTDSTSHLKKCLQSLWTCILIFINLSVNLTLVYFMATASENLNLTMTGDVIFKLLIVSEGLCAVMSILLNLAFKNKITQLLRTLQQCDEWLHEINLEMEFKSHRRFVWKFLVIYYLLTVLSCLYNSFETYHFVSWDVNVVIFMYALLVTLSTITVLSHMILTLIGIFVRFRTLNSGIRKFLNKNDSSVITTKLSIITNSNYLSAVVLIPKLAALHLALKELILSANQCFSFQVMLLHTKVLSNS